MKTFYYDNEKLFCEKIDLERFAQNRKTPFFIYSQKEILNNCNEVITIGQDYDFLPCYALKANYNPALLKLIRKTGFGADVVSGGEIYFALKAGFPAGKIVFAGVGKTEEEIKYALQQNIHSFNAESFQEMELISKTAKRLNRQAKISIRVNPDIDAQTHKYISTGRHINKFGVTEDEALEMYQQAAKDNHLLPQGIHVHIGSQISSAAPYVKTADFLHNFKSKLGQKGIEIKYLDLGGGIGINYERDFSREDKKATYLHEILPQYLKGLKELNIKLIAELGRSVIGSTAVLISKVLYRKETPLKKFLIIDAAMNNLIRPSIYDAEHKIVPVIKRESVPEIFDIVGPVCESTDFMAKEREMQPLKQGEFLAITGAGAYAQALASNYNLRPVISEYLVDDDKVSTIFERESYDKLASKYNWDE